MQSLRRAGVPGIARLHGHPFGHQTHQDVVIDPIEELLRIEIDHDVEARADVVLRTLHRPMSRASGPEPVAASEKLGSQSPCSTCIAACWMKRSSTVGTPSGRTPPDAFGISTRRTGCGV